MDLPKGMSATTLGIWLVQQLRGTHTTRVTPGAREVHGGTPLIAIPRGTQGTPAHHRRRGYGLNAVG